MKAYGKTLTSGHKLVKQIQTVCGLQYLILIYLMLQQRRILSIVLDIIFVMDIVWQGTDILFTALLPSDSY